MRSRNWTVLAVMCVVAAAVIGMLLKSKSANAQGDGRGGNRQITLSPQALEPFDIASGSFIVSPLEPFGRFFTYVIVRLRSGSQSTAYGLYLTVGDRERFRLRTFDTSGGEPQTESFRDFDGVSADAPLGSLPAGNDPAWVTDKVVVEVYRELDDGFDAPDVGGLLVLKGFSDGD